MAIYDNCCVCACSDASVHSVSGEKGNSVYVECEVCGNYTVSREAFCRIADDNWPCHKRRYLLSAFIRQRTRETQSCIIPAQIGTSKKVFNERIAAFVPTDMESKIAALLCFLADKAEHLGSAVPYHSSVNYPRGYCRNVEENQFLLKYLEETKLLQCSGQAYIITVAGWKRIEELKRSSPLSRQAFVAMSFDESLRSVFTEGIEPLKDDTGFTMRRVDSEEFNSDIVAEIIAQIRRSRFVIADVTKQSNGVYFEAGFAMGLGMPVIWTCHEDDIKKAHFDTNHLNHVMWKDAEELRKKLRNRIQGTIPGSALKGDDS